MDDPVSIALVGDYSGELVGDAQPALRLSEQHHPAIRSDPPAIERGAHLFRATAGRSKGSGIFSSISVCRP
jgi:hypothetical protein